MERLEHRSVFIASAWCSWTDCFPRLKPQAMLPLFLLSQEPKRSDPTVVELTLQGSSMVLAASKSFLIMTGDQDEVTIIICQIQLSTYHMWPGDTRCLCDVWYCSCQGAPDGIDCSLRYFWDFTVNSLGEKWKHTSLPFFLSTCCWGSG